MKTTIWVLTIAVLAVAAPTASDAKPQATCKTMCQRLTDCKMSSYTQTCLDACKQYGYEASEEGRAQLVTFTRYSCKQIQSVLAGTNGTNTHQHQRSATPNSSAPNPSAPNPSAPNPSAPNPSARPSARPSSTQGYDDEAELDSLEKELNDLDAQLGRDSEELERRSRGGKGPARGAGGPARGAGGPARGAGGRASAQSGGRSNGHGDSNEQDRGQPSGGHSNWTCVARGSIGTAYGNGPMNYSSKEWPDNGRTRDEAYLKALKGCNALMTTAANLGYLDGAVVEGGTCTVVDCRPTGT